jgi:hypothetical protein
MTRFFKKVSPQVRLQLSNGHNLQFDNCDGTWGILKVSNEGILSELATCIRLETGGVSEITEAEYDELMQKKTTSKPLWRDELTKNGAARRPNLTSQAASLDDAAAKAERFPDTQHAVRSEPIVPTATPGYRPEAIPRKQSQ